MVKNLLASAGDLRDLGLIPGAGRFPGVGNDNPLQCSSLENPMDRGAWWATVHGVAKSQTRLKRLSTAHLTLFIGAAGAAESYFLPRTMCMWPLLKGSKKFLKFEPAAILVIVVINDFFGYPAQTCGILVAYSGTCMDVRVGL